MKVSLSHICWRQLSFLKNRISRKLGVHLTLSQTIEYLVSNIAPILLEEEINEKYTARPTVSQGNYSRRIYKPDSIPQEQAHRLSTILHATRYVSRKALKTQLNETKNKYSVIIPPESHDTIALLAEKYNCNTVIATENVIFRAYNSFTIGRFDPENF